MSHSSDDPSNDRSSTEAPSDRPAEGLESEPANPSPLGPSVVSAEGDQRGATADAEEVPRLPRRRRRRRRRPPRPIDLSQATAAAEHKPEPPAAAGDAPQGADVPAVPPNAVGPRRRRRHRRGPPREPGAAEAAALGAAEAAESSPDAAPSSDGEPRQDRPAIPPHGRRRRRPPHPPAAETDRVTDGAPAHGSRTGAPQYRSGPYRGSQSRGTRDRRNRDERAPERAQAGDDRRFADRRARGERPPSRNNRRPGRNRDAPQKKPEPRLYALEAIVDRGFEDVVDAAEDNLTRRVHWTIVKRTVADHESGKPISATYVLKRDGVDTEFPGLAAARSAANKTIIHPEKLTMSKAEHAAELAAAKK